MKGGSQPFFFFPELGLSEAIGSFYLHFFPRVRCVWPTAKNPGL